MFFYFEATSHAKKNSLYLKISWKSTVSTTMQRGSLFLFFIAEMERHTYFQLQ